jgi:hypothetical protein
MRGSDRLGPFKTGELAALIDDGILLPEDACAPEEQPSQIRPISWWLASAINDGSHDAGVIVQTPSASTDASTSGQGTMAGAWRDDPLFSGKMALGGDTPVTRNDPPGNVKAPPPREQLHYRGRPNILAYGKSLLGGILLIAGILFASEHFPDHFPSPAREIALTLVAGLFCGLAIHRYASLYLVTSRRVEFVEGLVARSSREVRIVDIRAINVSRKGLRGLIGVGTVEFASAGGDDVEVAFRDVWNAAGIKRLVRSLQDQDSAA